MKRINYALLLLVSAFAFLSYTGLNAQELEVSPELNICHQSGILPNQQVSLRNKGNAEQSFIFNLSDWLTDENGEVKYFSPGTTPVPVLIG